MNLKTLLPLLCIVVVAGTQVSCGLEMPLVAFTAPEFGSASTADLKIFFQTKSDHFDEPATRLFNGYEVYYRIAHTEDFTAISDLKEYSQLSTYGFRKMYLSDDPTEGTIQEPLIEVLNGEGDVYPITFDFNKLVLQTGEPECYSVPAINISLVSLFELRRALPVSDTSHPDNGDFRRFSQAMPGDADIIDPDGDAFDGKVEGDGDQIDVTIEIYVYAEGRSTLSGSFWKKIRSALCCAGSIEIKMTYDDGKL